MTAAVLVQVGREQHPALQALRRNIISCFSDIGCFLMPHPGLVATTTKNFRGQLAGIEVINYVINSTFSKIFNTRSQETVDVCLEMFGCLQAERTISIRKRKFLNKFSVIHNALCRVSKLVSK